jgi:hypothetical protein
MKNIITGILLISSLFAFNPEARAGGFWHYLESCMTMGGVGAVGTGVAVYASDPQPEVDAIGYATSFGVGCLTGLVFTGILSDGAKFDKEQEIMAENEFLRSQTMANNYTLCLLRNTCKVNGTAVIQESAPKTIKSGDKVIIQQNSTIIQKSGSGAQ